jgi:hypothetical protein
MSALENARYMPHGVPRLRTAFYVVVVFGRKDDDSGPLLMKQMSGRVKGLLGSLMGQGDDMAALKAQSVLQDRRSLCHQRQRIYSLEQMSDASKGLLDTLMGLDDDSPAECSIYRSSRKQGHSAREDSVFGYIAYRPDVECFQGFALLMVNNSDDVVAFQSAVLTSSPKIISQDSFSSDESSNAWGVRRMTWKVLCC